MIRLPPRSTLFSYTTLFRSAPRCRTPPHPRPPHSPHRYQTSRSPSYVPHARSKVPTVSARQFARPQVADVRMPLHCRAAVVQRDHAGSQRLERPNRPGGGVVEVQAHPTMVRAGSRFARPRRLAGPLRSRQSGDPGVVAPRAETSFCCLRRRTAATTSSIAESAAHYFPN